MRRFYPSEDITPGVTDIRTFSTNSYGTRGKEPSGKSPIRTLTIGGSTTADTVLDDAEVWPASLERYLDDETGNQKRARVANSQAQFASPPDAHHLSAAPAAADRLRDPICGVRSDSACVAISFRTRGSIYLLV